MTFFVTKLIGSGQVFTTLQGWEDGAPVNYVTAEQSAATSFLVAAFTQGETLSFVGSGAAGKFLDTDSTGVGNGTYVSYGITSGNPAASDVVTGATSGATCVLSSSTPITTGCVWQGKINAASDVFSVGAATALNVAGGTVSSTAYLELTTATGAAFKDNASVATNPLRYDSTKGCAITGSGTYGTALIISNQNFSRYSYLQCANTANSGVVFRQDSGATLDVNGCIFEFPRAIGVVLVGATTIIRNSLIVARGAAASTETLSLHTSAQAYNCTCVTPSDKTRSTNVIDTAYGTPLLQNCALFFGVSLRSGAATPTYTTCATDVGGSPTPPTGVTQMTYDTTLFNNLTDATRDFRTPTGSGLRGAGTTDATNALVDIYGTTRVAPYDIGCWQAPAAGFQAAWAAVGSTVTLGAGAKSQ